MTQRDTEKQPLGAHAAPIGDAVLPPVDALAEVLRQLETIKQSLALTMLPAIPLDAFLTMLRDELKFDLPLRTGLQRVRATAASNSRSVMSFQVQPAPRITAAPMVQPRKIHRSRQPNPAGSAAAARPRPQ